MLNCKTLGLVALLPLMFFTAQSQETKKVSVKRKNDYFTVSEKYSVLKANPEIKEGPYSASISSYSEKGQFEQGIKAGVWEAYDGGKLVQKYDFKAQAFLLDNVNKMIASVQQIDEQGQAIKKLNNVGVYFGGDAKISSVLVRSVRYPADALQNNVQGWVVIEVKIDKQGRLTEEKAISTNGYGLEEEAMRVFKLLPADWLPVLVDGKPVDVKVQIRMSFRLSHLPPLKAD
jgi:TonB family protein